MSAPDIQFSATVNDTQLDRKIIEFTLATGRTVRDVGNTVIKGIVRDVIDITPPASGKANKQAQRAGEGGINADLYLMGFVPKQIKGYKEYKDTFWGHKLKEPLRIKTKPNPRFADPDAFHATRLRRKFEANRKRASRGGTQAFYVSESKFKAMRRRLYREVGKLAAGWVPAADRLGVSVPSWIRRHGSGNGGSISITYENGIRFRATNHFPETAAKEGTALQRRIEFVKVEAIRKLRDQLEAKLKGLWSKS